MILRLEITTMYNFGECCIKKTIREVFIHSKRYAGHSKWQNIKHIKAEKDAEKSLLFAQYAKRMKVAIAEGKSAKPHINLKLANIIEEAKKKSMPMATINGLLDKAENAKLKSQSELVDFRGPGNSIFIVRILSDCPINTKNNLHSLFRKNSCIASNKKHMNAFNHEGFVITEVQFNFDTAMNDAITVGAENVEEIEDNGKFYKFTCNPSHLTKISTHLSQLNYKIITSDEDFIPRFIVDLNDDDLKKVDILCEKLLKMEEIVSINHNINIPNVIV